MAKVQKYYVYTLTDPRDLKVFYIGKGTAARNYAHTHKLTMPQSDNMSPKSKLIRDIINDGDEVVSTIVKRFSDEQDAYDFEAELIAKTPGLLNAMAGGSGRKAKDEKKHGLTPKQERFSQLVAAGTMSQADCYREAYDAGNMTDKQIHEEASKLASGNPKVAQRIEQIKAPAVRNSQITREDILLGLHRATELAEQTAQAGAMVSALRELGKLIDAYPAERKEVQINDDMVNRIHAGRRMAAGTHSIN